MKKTLSLLAVAALGLCAAPCMAKTITLNPKIPNFESSIEGDTIAPGATLINTVTGGAVIYDINANPKIEPPFNIDLGYAYWGFELYDPDLDVQDIVSLEDVAVSEGDEIVLDFTTGHTGGGAGMGGPVDKEYFVIMFRDMTGVGNNFSTWYEGKDIPITARFTTGMYEAYIIDETCDETQSASTWGGLVFFRASDVAPKVRQAEVPVVPEPATATLSLLAFAGLAMRRRRR